MAEVVLDANVLVGFLDKGDALHERAVDLLDRLEKDGHDFVLLDIFNDALLLILARESIITNLASFDKDFDQVEGLRRIE
jgi:predicted nucleic acid-binding protein